MNNQYNKNLKLYARELRTDTVSKAEKYLWKAGLRRSQMGVKFKRQRPMFNFIVDFFSAEIKLIIEVDGSSHNHKGSYDRYRQNKLEEHGYTVSTRFIHGFSIPKPNYLLPLEMLEIFITQNWGCNSEL